MIISTVNVITIDVEDWYHSSLDIFKDSDVKHGSRPDESVVDNTLKTLQLLSETNNKATFFVLGTVAEHYPDIVKEILNQGHEVATHGYSHQLVYNMTPQSFEDDLKISFDHLEKASCSEILGYRAPYWSITKKSLWALEVLKNAGYAGAVSLETEGEAVGQAAQQLAVDSRLYLVKTLKGLGVG